MLRLRRVARLCSSTLSDTANRLRNGRNGNPTAVPHFRSGRRSPIFAGLTNKGKVGVQRGRETAGVPSFLPPRRAPQSPALRRAQLPAEVQRKTPRPSGANTLTQFEYPGQPVLKRSRPSGANTLTQFACPGQPVLKNSPPVRGEHANAVRVPRSAGAEKLPPVRGEPPAQFACPGQPVLKNSRPLGANRLRSSRAPVSRC